MKFRVGLFTVVLFLFGHHVTASDILAVAPSEQIENGEFWPDLLRLEAVTSTRRSSIRSSPQPSRATIKSSSKRTSTIVRKTSSRRSSVKAASTSKRATTSSRRLTSIKPTPKSVSSNKSTSRPSSRPTVRAGSTPLRSSPRSTARPTPTSRRSSAKATTTAKSKSSSVRRSSTSTKKSSTRSTARPTTSKVPTSLAPLQSRMANALQSGNEGLVTEKELLGALPNSLNARISLGFQLIPDNAPLTWLLNPNTAYVNDPGGLQNILFANKNLKPGDFPNDSPLAAAGTAPGFDTRLAYMGGNPFVTDDAGTYPLWKPVSDPGMQAFDENLLIWLLGLPIGTRGEDVGSNVSIVLAGIKDSAEIYTRTAITQMFPKVQINNGRPGNNACDFVGNSNPCLQNADILIVGDDRNPGDDAVANAIVQAYRSGIPLLIMTEDGNYSPISWKVTAQLGISLRQNYFAGHKVIQNSTKSYQVPNKTINDEFRKDVLNIVSYLTNDPLRPSDYAACIAANGQIVRTIRIGECVESPPTGVTTHALQYFAAIHNLQTSINGITSSGRDVFKASSGLNTETLRLLVLLANKIRVGPRLSTDTAVTIKYPINTRTDGKAVTRALFADWIVPMSTLSTPRASDLGSLWCFDGDDYQAGRCAAPSFPNIGSYRLILNSTLSDEWTSTGFTQIPGQATTIMLNNDPGIPIAVRTFATRNANSRTAEYTSAGTSLYNRPQFPVGPWIMLQPGVPVTVNSPYGGPLYVGLDGSTLTSPRQATLSFSNVSKHFAVLDASDDASLKRLAQDLMKSPAYWVDIVGSGFELHVPAGKLKQSLSPEGLDVGVGRKIYYNSTMSGLGQLMIDYKKNWAEREYRMAGLKIDGESLDMSLPTEVQKLCQFLKWNCLDETIHRITGVQHLTYDAYAACGQLCSGNPITSSTAPAPIGWGEGHELGHNLQRTALNIYWPDTRLGKQIDVINSWPNYSIRSTEVSNNIFPYFNQWAYFRLELPSRFGTGRDDSLLRRHDNEDMTIAFSAHQSAYSKLRQNGQNVVLDHTCKVLGAFPLGTRSDVMLADAIWSNNGYAVNNGERMSFYFALPQILQGKKLANDAVLADGRNIYTLLYAAARLFSTYAANATTWQANAASIGFSRYGYTNDAVYGAGSTVAAMIGNDFLVVSLSLVTGFDFRPYFAAHGIFYTALANTQVTANAPSGGYLALGSPHVVLGNQYPKTDLSMVNVGGPGAYLSRNVGIDMGNAATVWPGADNDNNGKAEDLVGFHPKSCPGVTVGA